MAKDFKYYATVPLTNLEKELETNYAKGLTSEKVEENILKYGLNRMEKSEITWISILFRQFKSSFVYLLIASALFSIFLGEKLDSIVIISFISINVAFGFFQEFKSEKSIKLLKKYIVSQSKVKRNGKEILIPTTELVPGDILLVSVGDIIPADARILNSINLEIDESSLTGESIQISKNEDSLKKNIDQIYDATNILFSGTSVIKGKAEAVIFSTFKNTEFGKSANLANNTKRQSLFEKEINSISSFILKLVGASLVLYIVAAGIFKGPSYFTSDMVLFAVALAVSVIPEALPTVITFSLSRGALLLSKHKVIIKRLTAIKDLGGIDILCTDKTGTITENIMEITNILSKDKEKTILYAGMVSKMEGVERVDSFDLAIYEKLTTDNKREISQTKKLIEIPFDPIRKRNSILIGHNWKDKDDYSSELIIRGAPETIIKYCKNITQKLEKEIQTFIKKEGEEGKRLIAVAYKSMKQARIYKETDETEEITFLGIISFIDPVKDTAKETIQRALSLGVQVKILTGDSLGVAYNIGKTVGLANNIKEVIEGNQLELIGEDKLLETCEKYHVFARVTPEQKYKIINILEKKHSVGFLGEGINDAPALKIANVGIVVNNASEIARDAADVLLLKKSLNTLIDGILEGRKVFSNTTEYIKATLASNFGNFFALIISGMFLEYLPLLPLQILLLNLLSDFPMIAIASDTVDDIELEKPSKFNFSEFTRIALLLGIVSTTFDLIYFFTFKLQGEQILHTAWFIGSVITELSFVFSIRKKGWFFEGKAPSKVIMWLTAITYILTIVIPYTVWGHDILKFVSLSAQNIVIVIIIGSVYFTVTEIVKNLYYRKFNVIPNDIA